MNLLKNLRRPLNSFIFFSKILVKCLLYTRHLFSVHGMGGERICLQCRRPGFDSWVRKIPWRRTWQPTPVFLLGKFHGQRSLAGCSPWGHKSRTRLSDQTSTTHTSELGWLSFSHSCSLPSVSPVHLTMFSSTTAI